MKNQQRRAFIETSYSSGILFDEADTLLAYKVLSRATVVSKYGKNVKPIPDEDVEIVLVSPKNIAPAEREENVKAITEALAAPAPEVGSEINHEPGQGPTAESEEPIF